MNDLFTDNFEFGIWLWRISFCRLGGDKSTTILTYDVHFKGFAADGYACFR